MDKPVDKPNRPTPAPVTPTVRRAANWDDYRQLWLEANSRDLLTDYPIHLDIELAGTCNLKCAMCWQSGDLTAPLGIMDDTLFKKIIGEGVAQGLCSIKLQSRGESLLHPRIGALARFAKDHGVLDVQLTTNATLFAKPGKIDSILQSGIDKLIFSIDDAHNKSAQEIYGKDAVDVRKIIQEVFGRRSQLHSSGPTIRVQTIAPIGISQEACLAELQAAFPHADEYLVNLLWNSNSGEESLPGLTHDFDFFPCTYLWTRLAVFWNGDITTCCRDYNCKMKLGSAVDENIKDIWLGPKMMEYRYLHLQDKRKSMDICANCDISTRRR